MKPLFVYSQVIVACLIAAPRALGEAPAATPLPAEETADGDISAEATAELQLAALADAALEAMGREDWLAAEHLLESAVEEFGGGDAFERWGPRFGVVWFRKGTCELNLEKWQQAAASFEVCYRDFPNPPSLGRLPNPFRHRALLKWGEAAMGAEEWDGALQRFEQFLNEREPLRDPYDPGAFHAGIALCRFRLGDFPGGTEALEMALANRSQRETPDAAIVSGIAAMVDAGVASPPKDKEIAGFLASQRAALHFGPDRSVEIGNQLLTAAHRAAVAGFSETALKLYRMVPGSHQALATLQERKKALEAQAEISLGSELERLEALATQMDALQKAIESGEVPDVTALLSIAVLLEKKGDLDGAREAYQRVVKEFPGAEEVPRAMYQLARTALASGRLVLACDTARAFLARHPLPAATSDEFPIWISALFSGGDHATSGALAGQALTELPMESPARDLPLHIAGAAAYFQGDFHRALELLEQHSREFPGSQIAEANGYYLALTLAQTGNQPESARMLAEIANRGEADSFFWFARYQKLVDGIDQGAPEATLAELETIIASTDEPGLMGAALVMKGAVLEDLGRAQQAREAYLAARASGREAGDEDLTASALFRLITAGSRIISGSDEERAARLHEFWQNHANSRFTSELARSPLALGISEEDFAHAIEVTRQSALAAAAAADEIRIRNTLETYAAIFLIRKSPEELQDDLARWPDPGPAFAILWRSRVLTAFRDRLEGSERLPLALREQTRLEMRSMAAEIHSRAAVPDQPSEVLLELIRSALALNEELPRALELANELRRRAEALSSKQRMQTRLLRAELWLRLQARDQFPEALAEVTEIAAEASDPGATAYSEALRIRLLAGTGEWEEVISLATGYLAAPTPTERQPFEAQVEMLLAKAFRETGNLDDALAMYLKISGARTGDVAISAAATRGWMELYWERNSPATPGSHSDREAALRNGEIYLKLTRPWLDDLDPAARAAREEVVSLVTKYRTALAKTE